MRKFYKIEGYRRLFNEEIWEISFLREAFNVEDGFDSFEGKRLVTIRSPFHSFYADPFCISYKGENYIFFETLSFIAGKGRIGYVKLNADGKPTRPKTILKTGYHLSYPFIFEYENEVYLIPEAGDSRAIVLYRAKEFPDQWEYVKTLIDGIGAYDTTIFRHDNIFYMFTYMLKENALAVYYSDSLMSEWKLHPKSPVAAGDFNSRPAGSIMNINGSLYRPGQDSRLTYGHSLVLNRIKLLTATDYEEEACSILEPEKLKKTYTGTHTININTITVLDHKRIRFNILKPVTRLCNSILKLANNLFRTKKLAESFIIEKN